MQPGKPEKLHVSPLSVARYLRPRFHARNSAPLAKLNFVLITGTSHLGSERNDGAGWDYGTELEYLTELITYWRDDFDWREQERRLNAFDHYKTVVDGLDIHFIHQRSPEPDALPLIITHGWPGSIVEFMEVIGPLTDPVAHGGDAADAFHVVAPSMPGYGFSDKPIEPGFGPEQIAEVGAQIMERLGYERYGICLLYTSPSPRD